MTRPSLVLALGSFDGGVCFRSLRQISEADDAHSADIETGKDAEPGSIRGSRRDRSLGIQKAQPDENGCIGSRLPQQGHEKIETGAVIYGRKGRYGLDELRDNRTADAAKGRAKGERGQAAPGRAPGSMKPGGGAMDAGMVRGKPRGSLARRTAAHHSAAFCRPNRRHKRIVHRGRSQQQSQRVGETSEVHRISTGKHKRSDWFS